MKSDLSIRSAIYLRAAEIIEEKGLCKDDRGVGDDGSVCALVALYQAADSTEWHPMFDIVHQETDGLLWYDYVALPHVTAEMVAARFRELA